MSKVLLSGCLFGQNVRYDGKNCLSQHPRLKQWIREGKIVTVCPEVSGELSVPRLPEEIQNSKTGFDVIEGQANVVNIGGQDVTREYLAGAEQALALAKQHNIKVAILKEKSPSCGSTIIPNGTFSKTMIKGKGVTAALLEKNGVKVFNESQIDEALDLVEKLEDREC